MKKSYIEVEGVRYPVADNLGFQPSSGCHAKEVERSDGTLAIAVKPPKGKAWRFWTAADRLGRPS